MKEIFAESSGNVAIIFALAILPLVGAVGAAVDYSRANAIKESLRSFSDQIALAVASSEDPGASGKMLAAAKGSLQQMLSHNVENVVIDGHWLDSANYKVTINADVPLTLLSAVPGIPNYVNTSAVTIANRTLPKYRTLPPSMSMLDPDAADYNRLHMYCYDPARANEKDKGRGKPVAIADNSSNTVYDAELPQCGAGEIMGYMLRNVRDARVHRSRWDDPKQEVYEYYTDTTLDANTRALKHRVQGYRVRNGQTGDTIDMSNSGIMETVLCRNERACRPKSRGGVIPNPEKGRKPLSAGEACEEGMFMYFGWEDRPAHPSGHAHKGWTDEDYDDIRLIVSCPEVVQDGAKQIRIVF